MWQITAQFFATMELKAQSAAVDVDALAIRREEMPELDDYESAAPHVHGHVRAVLAEANIAYPEVDASSGAAPIKRVDGSALPADPSYAVAPAWIGKCHNGFHAALVETERHRLNRASSYDQLALRARLKRISLAAHA